VRLSWGIPWLIVLCAAVALVALIPRPSTVLVDKDQPKNWVTERLGVAKNKLPSWYTALWIILILVLGGSLYAYMGDMSGTSQQFATVPSLSLQARDFCLR
jgi:hypothetical protein